MHSPRFLTLAFVPFTGAFAIDNGDLVAAAAEVPVAMSALEVRAERAQDQNYKAERSHTATKTDTPLQEVPQSISVITQEQLQDQQMVSISDVVRYMPGLSAHQGENNRDQVIFRGNSSSADFFLNGVRDDVQYYRDVYNLDRIEILRGPNAMIFGRGGGGGIINRSTKEADFSPLHEFSLQAGSFAQHRATADFNVPLGSHAAFRLNGVYEDAGSFRQFVELSRRALNPTVTFRPSNETRITASYEYLHDARVADRGVTSFAGRPADVPFDTYYGNPADSHVRATVHLATANVEHRTGTLTLRNRTLVGDYDRGYQNYVPGAPNSTGTLVALTAYNNATTRRNVFNQTDAALETDTGAWHHTLLGGVEVGRQLTGNFRNTGYFGGTATSLLVPYSAPLATAPVTFRQSATDANNHVKADLTAVYLQDQIKVTRRLQAILGVRFDSFALQFHNRRNGDYLGRRDNLVSPRAGVVYELSPHLALYGSYSVSSLPSSGDQFSSLTSVTQQVRPEGFRNYEVGTKVELPANLAVTAAVYRLDRVNTRATDPNDPTRILQTGSQRSNGFEFGLTGSIRPRWTTFLGYAWQDARIRSATTAARTGAIVPQVPKHSFSLWNKYQVLPGLSVGVGIVQRTAVFAGIDDTVTLPGYTRVDAAVFYTLSEHFRLQLNVENLLDRRYWSNADSNTNISPGSPRAIRVGLTTRF